MMPIIFTFFFLWFPAGLVLYWVVNNVLSISQQWYITRKIEAATKKPRRNLLCGYHSRRPLVGRFAFRHFVLEPADERSS